MPQTDSSDCPLCGQSNQCAMAAGLAADQCWCMTRPVAPEALQRLPAERRGRSCICPGCARPLPPPQEEQPI